MNKTIGFFGDSFCAEKTNLHSLTHGYKSYIKLLSEHYGANVVHLGKGGSGVWDTLLLQIQPMIDNGTVPDICVFVWTLPGRIFNRKVRRLNDTDVVHKMHLLNKDVWNAASEFYTHLYDAEKEQVEYVACLRYIDQVVLPKLPATTQIVHLWSVGNTIGWDIESIRPANITYPHEWEYGSEVRPSLLSLSMYDNDLDILKSDTRINHLDGKFKNETLFNWVKLAIDNPNSFWDYTIVVDKLYDKSQQDARPAI